MGEDWISLFLGRGLDIPSFFQRLSDAAHFYGRPIPLLHKSHPHRCEVAILNVGGLLFLMTSIDMCFFLVDTTLTLQQLTDRLDQGLFPAEELHLDSAQEILEYWFDGVARNERENSGRNRCLELFRRGGRVNSRFLHPRRK